MDSKMDIDTDEPPTGRKILRNSIPGDYGFKRPARRSGQASPSSGRPKKAKSEPSSTTARLTKHVTLKYNSAKVNGGMTQESTDPEPSESNDIDADTLEPLSAFLFVPPKYWVDLEAPDKLFKVASSPQDMPTWHMPAPERVRCGIYISKPDFFNEKSLYNVRNAYMPVFLVSQVTRPFYKFFTCGRSIREEFALLDRPFRVETARLETTRSTLQNHLNDVKAAFAIYSAAMSEWRSAVRSWEVQTIHHELKVGNRAIFRNRITDDDLEELDDWLRVEEEKESAGHYDTWYAGVLRQGYANIYAPAHLLRSVPIKELIEQRLDSVRTAVDTLGKMIEELEGKPMTCSPPPPRPLIDLPDCSSDEEEIPPDEQHLVNLTVWAYERHLHWIPRESESRKKKYKFKTEDDVYHFFQIKKLTCSDFAGAAGNNGLFQEHIRIPQDLNKYPWGLPFHVLERSVPLATHDKKLYSEEGRTILRDMEAEYFNNPQSVTPETGLLEWSSSGELAYRIRLFLDRMNE